MEAGPCFSSSCTSMPQTRAGPPPLLPINTILMKAARAIVGHKSQNWRNIRTLKEINWLSVPQKTTLTAVKTGHKIIHQNLPETISYKINQNRPKI